MTDQPRLPIDPDKGFPTMPAADFLALRESVGTQTDVAIELQTARKTLGRWERGERPVPGIAAVAMTLLADKAKARRAATIDHIRAMDASAAEAVE